MEDRCPVLGSATKRPKFALKCTNPGENLDASRLIVFAYGILPAQKGKGKKGAAAIEEESRDRFQSITPSEFRNVNCPLVRKEV